MIARDALEAGLDSPALRQLAGETSPTLSSVGPLFDRALDELGFARATRAEAALILATAYARQILTGTIGAYDGARRIWRYAWNEDRDQRVAPFVHWASEFEEYRDADRRTECERGIMEAGQALVEGGGHGAA